jgi:hypothetical protein
LDWREIAEQLLAEHPEQWAPPGGDPLDAFRDFDPLA